MNFWCVQPLKFQRFSLFFPPNQSHSSISSFVKSYFLTILWKINRSKATKQNLLKSCNRKNSAFLHLSTVITILIIVASRNDAFASTLHHRWPADHHQPLPARATFENILRTRLASFFFTNIQGQWLKEHFFPFNFYA